MSALSIALRAGSVSLAVAISAVASIPGHAHLWSGSGPAVVVVGGTSADRARLAEALGMFEAAGLVLGGAEVRFVEEGVGGCGERWLGEYRSHWHGSVVRVCTDSQRTLVHELAHVWLDRHLSRRDRARLVEQWGLPTWRGEEVPWGERASEHAAEIIVWGVMPGTVPRVTDIDPDRLSAAYTSITGRPSAIRERGP